MIEIEVETLEELERLMPYYEPCPRPKVQVRDNYIDKPKPPPPPRPFLGWERRGDVLHAVYGPPAA